MAGSTSDPTGRWEEVGDISGDSGQAWVKEVRDSTGQHEGTFARKVFKSWNRMDRIRREVSQTKRLHSEGAPVVQVVDEYFPEKPGKKNRPAYVMNLVKSGSLRKTVENKRYAGDLKRSIVFLMKLHAALEQIHALGVAHRDLKPENILMGLSDQPILCDLGLCLVLEEEEARISASLEQMGSRHYIAPEALGGIRYVRHPIALDAYAFGKIAYELLAGRILPGIQLPVEEDQLGNVLKQPNLPGLSEFSELIGALLKHEPEPRLAAWQRAGMRLRAILEADPPQAPEHSHSHSAPVDRIAAAIAVNSDARQTMREKKLREYASWLLTHSSNVLWSHPAVVPLSEAIKTKGWTLKLTLGDLRNPRVAVRKRSPKGSGVTIAGVWEGTSGFLDTYLDVVVERDVASQSVELELITFQAVSDSQVQVLDSRSLGPFHVSERELAQSSFSRELTQALHGWAELLAKGAEHGAGLSTPLDGPSS